jgi:hypothetical protein
MSAPPTGTRREDRVHVTRVIILLAVAAVFGLAFQAVLRPSGLGAGGKYQRGVLEGIISKEPLHQGKAVCGECHAEIHQTHQKDIHFDVQCEDCHGPGADHVQAQRAGPPAEDDPARLMPKEYTLEGCLFCHRRLNARPADFPQIDPVAHYEFLKVTAPETRCIECHSPHEPVFLLTRVTDARVHPVVYECTYCHDERPVRSHREATVHPVIFACADCHQEIVSDFKERRHTFMDCTACHFFHRENEVAGRIFKNGNRRFCLLCHEKKSFKDTEKVPGIVSRTHLTEFAELLGLDPVELAADPRACLKCHLKEIHNKKLMGR